MKASPRSLTQSDKDVRFVRGLLRVGTPPPCRRQLDFETTTTASISSPPAQNQSPQSSTSNLSDGLYAIDEQVEGHGGSGGEGAEEEAGEVEDSSATKEESVESDEKEDEEEQALDSESSTAIHDLQSSPYNLRPRRCTGWMGRTDDDRTSMDNLFNRLMFEQVGGGFQSDARTLLHQVSETVVTSTFRDAAKIAKMRKDDVIRKGDFTTAFELAKKRKRKIGEEDEKMQGGRKNSKK